MEFILNLNCKAGNVSHQSCIQLCCLSRSTVEMSRACLQDHICNKVCVKVGPVASCSTPLSWPWDWWGQGKKGRNFRRFYLRAPLVYREKHYKYSFCECLHLLSTVHWRQSLCSGGEITSLHRAYMLLVGFTPLFCFAFQPKSLH